MAESLTFVAKDLKNFAERVFVGCGAPRDEAEMIAGHLVQANLMGYDSHGIIRVRQYVDEVKSGRIIPGAPINIKQETGTTAIVDCGWNFGQVGALRALQCAVDKARAQNTATVVTRRCSHVGRLGAYTQAAAEQGFIAIAACNSPPGDGHFVLPWGGREGRLSTNPISFAIPCGGGAPILADFSTSQAPEGKIRLYLNQKKNLPNGWIVDAKGNPSNDPAVFYGPPRGGILPFGGDLGYRGFALGLLMESLAGLLAGTRTPVPQPGNGICFIVINVAAFLPPQEFSSLTQELRGHIKSSPVAPGHKEVVLPGELDFRLLEERTAKGIPIDAKTWEQICASAETVGVTWDGKAVV
ncbi:MAG: Ldh family oxidoreductase [Terriglobia bacterium]